MDNIPYNGYWYETMNGVVVDILSKIILVMVEVGGKEQLPSINGTTEKAYKYNVSWMLLLFGGLTLMV